MNLPNKTYTHVLNNLENLGVAARRRPGRGPAGLPPGAGVWVLGPADQEVLALPWQGDRIRAATAELLPHLPRLWVGRYVKPAVARRWIAEGRAFADAAGNTFLNFPGLVVHVTGKAALADERAAQLDEGVTQWRAPALRLLFQVLCDPELITRPIRALAQEANVAAGTVVNLIDQLERDGQLVRLEHRKRRLTADRELIDRWIAEFGRILRPKLVLGRFDVEDERWHERFDPTEHGALWGAEPAAAKLGADLRPGTWTLYVEKIKPTLLKDIGARAHPQGKLELRRVFWTHTPKAPTPGVVAPLLVAADLHAIRDGRCRAAADQVLKAHVDGFQ